MHSIQSSELIKALSSAGVELSKNQIRLLIEFHELLRKVNPEINVTRLHHSNTIIHKHYVDSLIVLPALSRSGIELPARTMDLGSGGGFPGIPLAIATPEKEFILVEGRKKRTNFLRSVVDELNLKNVKIISRKMVPGDVIECDAVITRAFESAIQTAERVRASLYSHGLLIFMKGPNIAEEIESMNHASEWIHKRTIQYTLPDSDDRRNLLVYEKKKENATDHRTSVQKIESSVIRMESESNEKVKRLIKLGNSRSIKKYNQSILFGQKFIKEALHYHNKESHWSPLALIVPDSFLAEKYIDILIHSGHEQLPVWKPTESIEKKITGGHYLLPALLFEFQSPADTPLLKLKSENSVLLPLQNPDNLGAAIRSCLAFGFGNIVLSNESANPYHRDSLRASAGAALRVKYKKLNMSLEDSIQVIKTDDLIILDQNKKAKNIHEFKWPESGAILAVGTEGTGFPDSARNLSTSRSISIPIRSDMESLNAAVSLSIALYEWHKYIQSRKT